MAVFFSKLKSDWEETKKNKNEKLSFVLWKNHGIQKIASCLTLTLLYKIYSPNCKKHQFLLHNTAAVFAFVSCLWDLLIPKVDREKAK